MNVYKVGFALLLYDEFDGAEISDVNVIFRYNGRSVMPLRKKDGFYLFREDGQQEAKLEIIRSRYHDQCECIVKSGLDPVYPVVRVRLMRKYSGAFTDCEWFHGRCPPGSKLFAFAEERLKFGSFEQDEKGKKINLLGYGTKKLSGQRFTVDPDGRETFIMGEMLFPGVYRVNKIPDVIPKTDCSLYRAYLSRGNEDGSYTFPADAEHTGKISKAEYFDEEKKKWVYVSATVLK